MCQELKERLEYRLGECEKWKYSADLLKETLAKTAEPSYSITGREIKTVEVAKLDQCAKLFDSDLKVILNYFFTAFS